MKRLAASRLLAIERKSCAFLTKPLPGMHELGEAIPLLVLVRDVLHLAGSKREAKAILAGSEVLVDGVPRTGEGFPVGLMDVVSIPKLNVHYRIVAKHGKLLPEAINAQEAGIKLCKVVGKRLVRGGRIQLAFHDGRTQLIEKEEDRFSLGDTVKLRVPKQAIEGFLKLEKGARCYIHSGKHAGELATLEQVLERAGSAPSEVRLRVGDNEIITRKDYVLVVDDGFKLS